MKLLIILLLLTVTGVFAESTDNTRNELAGLLKNRQILFEQYSASLEKKSGFFGNKTKNDLRDSQSKLKEIVEADNKIMSVLNRTVDFRNYEKLNMTYDASSNTKRIDDLNSLNESLMKQVNSYTEEIRILKGELKNYRLYNVLIIALLILVLVFKAVRKYFNS